MSCGREVSALDLVLLGLSTAPTSSTRVIKVDILTRARYVSCVHTLALGEEASIGPFGNQLTAIEGHRAGWRRVLDRRCSLDLTWNKRVLARHSRIVTSCNLQEQEGYSAQKTERRHRCVSCLCCCLDTDEVR